MTFIGPEEGHEKMQRECTEFHSKLEKEIKNFKNAQV